MVCACALACSGLRLSWRGIHEGDGVVEFPTGHHTNNAVLAAKDKVCLFFC
ncbi:hypothetical protein DPMN_048157 [Dreissena polymorpha]|uniref:Uncharacterized protein n=1 Tax=Dreissena polymorpha TaxID=45954 RepID=A0A9D4DB29_DREPO|nr:hypothetical protein DPMN_048157 [Dreissena polymorpha]